MSRFIRAFALATLVVIATPLGAARRQDLDVVRQTLERFAIEQTRDLPGAVSIEVPALDPRLQLTSCNDLQPYVPPGSRLWGRTHVGVRCAGPDRWSITVQVVVRVMGSAIYTARPVGRGQRLTESDIDIRPADLAQLPAGVVTDPTRVIGQQATIALAAGLPLRRDMVHGEHVVTAGQPVRLIFSSNGLEVSSEGKALGGGAVGDDVQVRTASGKVVRGSISGPGIVQVR